MDEKKLNMMTVKQLQEISRNMKLSGFYKLRKSELIKFISENLRPKYNIKNIAKILKIKNYENISDDELNDIITKFICSY